MNSIIFYSNTNQSKIIAEYFKQKLNWNIYDLNNFDDQNKVINNNFEKVILVFPVYCQNIPDLVKYILINLKAKYLIAIATYGKMCYGRTLYDVKKYYKNGKIIGAAYIPMKHSYLDELEQISYKNLDLILDKINNNILTEVNIKKTYRNIFSSFYKDLRSRMLVKMKIDLTKCTNCGLCEKECLYHGIKNHQFTRKCIRCLKCKTNCPVNAITHKNRYILNKYLKNPKQKSYDIYI